MVNPSASLDDDEIIQEVLGCKSAESDSDTEDEEKDTVVKKISLNEGIDALKKSLIFLEQQDNVDFKTEDLTAVRRLINQITLHHLSLLRQTSIELFLQ